MVNFGIRVLFRVPLNDTTNAFKAYRQTVVEGCRPLIAPHFNLTVELPLKAMVRGYSWTVMPITWRNRRTGEAKLKLKEMGSRYLFVILYVWLEKYFSRGDYRKQVGSQQPRLTPISNEPAGEDSSTTSASAHGPGAADARQSIDPAAPGG
jgi:dolichol-phosphate mannosyltransferase